MHRAAAAQVVLQPVRLPLAAFVGGAPERAGSGGARVRLPGARRPRRKGDDTPYADHPIEVAHLLHEEGFDETVVAAGLLHDVVEDTNVTLAEIWARFGPEVAGLVETVTEDKTIRDYSERKDQHRQKVRAVGLPAAAIFAADKLANLRALRAAYGEQGRR